MARKLSRLALAGALLSPLASCESTPPQSASAGAAAVAQTAVNIQMPAGTAEGLLFTPQGRRQWPAVLVWTDLVGLRPAYADLGRKLAAEGYVVLVPDEFYRSARVEGRTSPAPLTPEQSRERATKWTAAISDEASEADAKAYFAYLDALPQVDKTRKAGTIGYQYGAPYAFHTAFAMPDRIGAVAVLHPFRIATTRPNSPHLFVNRSKAAYYVALATVDDAREPDDKTDLRGAFAKAGLNGTVEVLPGNNGFAVADLPAYDAASEAAGWSRIVALFHDRLR